MERIFEDRVEAGRRLAVALSDYRGRDDVVVLGLARGGMPVAYEVASELNVPLEVMVVRKLGVPGHSELAMGAIALGGVLVMNERVVRSLALRAEDIDEVAERERAELVRREQAYRGGRDVVELAGRVVILVDDGLATGATMRAAVEAVKTREPSRIVVAVPTGAPETCESLEPLVDEVVCVTRPELFFGVSRFYRDFSQITDEEVQELLERAHRREPAAGTAV